MKNNLLFIIILFNLLVCPKINFGQAPNLGTAADFVLFSSVGALSNTGISQITGNVGTNSGSSTGFGNVNGVMHNNNGTTLLCGTDVLLAYNQLNSTVPTLFLAPLLGNGQILTAGVYSIPSATTLNLDLTLDGLGNSNSVFIFQIQGPFSANASAKIKLVNGALACNVFWKIEGLVSMASGVSMKGTIIANNAAINMSTGDTLEGRALSTAGAITLDGVLAYTPIGCGSPILTGPIAPTLASSECYTLFSSIGPVTNAGVTHVIGDVGTNNGLTTGFNPLFVVGAIHPVPDGSTALCATDLLNAYNYLNTLPYDIELLYPAQFGKNLVLTPHTYLMNGAATFTDSLYLNAQGNANAVFVIKINGALSTSTYSKVKLINGTQAKNVYWKVEGAVDINDYSVFKGTIVCNNGAMSLNTGVTIEGRALTTTGALNTAAITATMPPGCGGTSSPSITTQPSNQTACDGGFVSFSVAATGTNLTYQWRKGSTNLIDGGNISGSNSATLTLNPVSITDVASNYNVIIGGTFAPNDTSINVSLILNTAPSITNEPSNQTVCAGSSVSFSVAATGTNISYQWRKGSNNLIDGGNISGSNSATLTLNPTSVADAASNYNVIITGDCLPNDTSINVSLILNTAPSITNEPSNQTICTGSSVSFSVAATGTNISYQWRKGVTNLIDGGNISGSNSATLTLNPTSVSDAASNYNVIITGDCLPNDTSINGSLIFNTAPSITNEPINRTACNGGSVSFSVAATGTNISYQWRKGITNLIDGGNISGSNSATLTLNPTSVVDAASDYNVIITGDCAPNDTSINVSLLLNGGLSITNEPSNQIICAGSSVSFSVAATGTNLTYQWRKGSTNLMNGGTISGSNSATLTLNPTSVTDAASDYNVIITGDCAPNDTSINVSLILNTAPSITNEPSNQTVCAGSSVSFSVAATGTNISYQWRKGSTNLMDGGNISGSNTATLTLNPASVADAASNYNVIITGDCLPNDTSINVSLILNTAPSITNEPSNQTACAGSSVSFSVAATGTNISYQWRKGVTNLIDGGNISGSNSATLTLNPTSITDVASNYNVVITGDCAPNDTSINVSLILNTAPSITTEPSNQTICAGSSVSFSVSAIGTNISYQWRKGSANLIDGGNISGSNSATLTLNSTSVADAASNYNVVITGDCAPNDTSINVSLILNTAPSITTEPSNQTVCTGSSVSFSVAATGTNISYQWRKGNANLIDGGNVSGSNSATLTLNPTSGSDAASNYNVIITGDCNPNDTSINVSLTIDPAIIAVANSNSPICIGSAINLTAQTVSGAIYNWTGPNGYTSSTQNPTIMSSTTTDEGTYSLIVSSSNCTSAPASVVIIINNCDSIDFNIPEGFSPNGDGINDLFVIRGIKNYPKNTFEIFNRWGNKVFKATPYENTWDGTANEGLTIGGDNLPIGTYFYILDLGDGSSVFKGTIYLNK